MCRLGGWDPSAFALVDSDFHPAKLDVLWKLKVTCPGSKLWASRERTGTYDVCKIQQWQEG
jgi:hypothetical protein